MNAWEIHSGPVFMTAVTCGLVLCALHFLIGWPC